MILLKVIQKDVLWDFMFYFPDSVKLDLESFYS